jgi:integrase
VSHIKYTICRSGSYYYNRRVPKHAVQYYGQFIRCLLSTDIHEAKAYAERLSDVLESSWSGSSANHKVDIPAIINSFKPTSYILSDLAEEYISLKQIDEKSPRSALATFISLAGDRDVSLYSREDAKLLIHHLELKGNKTTTIRRRINSLSAILNYAYSELDLDKRNPFTRLFIRNEGHDVFKRGTFSKEQLTAGYDKALASGSTVKLLMPLLGETGCRLSEIVGLRIEDIDMDNDLIHIRPNAARRLKTRGSERTLPLVGCARLAMLQALSQANEEWLYPRYMKTGKCNANSASVSINKWLKRDFDDLTAHCLRHTMRDRLRAVECPMDMIDQIGGWRSVATIGVGYGKGYSLEAIRAVMTKL